MAGKATGGCGVLYKLLRAPSGSLGTVRKSWTQSPDRALQPERPQMVAAGRGARLLRGSGGSLGTVRKPRTKVMGQSSAAGNGGAQRPRMAGKASGRYREESYELLRGPSGSLGTVRKSWTQSPDQSSAAGKMTDGWKGHWTLQGGALGF